MPSSRESYYHVVGQPKRGVFLRARKGGIGAEWQRFHGAD
jgi:hypothetical protein